MSSVDPFNRVWIGYVESIIRRRRQVAWGVIVASAIVLGAHFLIPRSYDSEVTLSLPPVAPATEKGVRRPGTTLTVYKKLMRVLADRQVLSAGLADVLTPAQIESVRLDLAGHVEALTTNALPDLRRINEEDTIVALRLSYSATSERADRVVSALATLSRSALLNQLLLDLIAAHLTETAEHRMRFIDSRRASLQEADSLAKLLQDTERIVAESPQAGAVPQQVVDVRDGADVFLPPRAQVVGVKSHIAQLAHRLRQFDRQIAYDSLLIEFLAQLSQRIEGDLRRSASRQLPAVIREELARFTSARQREMADLSLFSQQVEQLALTIDVYDRATVVIQAPSARRRPRGTTTLGLLAATLLMVFVAAILWDALGRPGSASANAPRADA